MCNENKFSSNQLIPLSFTLDDEETIIAIAMCHALIKSRRVWKEVIHTVIKYGHRQCQSCRSNPEGITAHAMSNVMSHTMSHAALPNNSVLRYGRF